jgi:hypothetical protein
MWFWTADDLSGAAHPYFQVEEVVGVGTVAPPPYAGSRLAHHPSLFAALCRLDWFCPSLATAFLRGNRPHPRR